MSFYFPCARFKTTASRDRCEESVRAAVAIRHAMPGSFPWISSMLPYACASLRTKEARPYGRRRRVPTDEGGASPRTKEPRPYGRRSRVPTDEG
ncbi:MAG: hypothetical protein LBG27_06845, partial [Spirochaetaceae bacterium]|nr:hypothetical protein [Spirochaetaceae bacterium]